MAESSSLARGPGAELVFSILRGSGISQAELARRAGLPRSVMNAYLRGKREPGASTLARLAAAAGIEIALRPRRRARSEVEAGRRLVQVLELAEALPYRPRPENYPDLRRLVSSPSR